MSRSILSLNCAGQSWAVHPFSPLCWPIMSPTSFLSTVLTNHEPYILSLNCADQSWANILSLNCADQSWALHSFSPLWWLISNHEPNILSLNCADQSWALHSFSQLCWPIMSQHPFSQLCWPIMSPTFFFSIVLTNQMPAISFLIFQLINLKLLSLYPSVFILTMLVPWWNSRIRGRWLAYPDQASSCTLPTGQSGLSCIKGLLTYGPPAITGLSWLNW